MKILVLSDIHANWPALQAVLRAEPNADRIVCLGDLVSYGPQPVQCVNWAMQLGPSSIILQGNHDHAFGLGRDPRCSAAYQPLAAAMQSATSHLLTPEMKQFLGALEPLHRFRCGDLDSVACHATPSDPLYSYLTERSAPARWESEVARAGNPDILFVGHTHLPMRTQVNDTLVFNPGSVGQPKDGDPHAAYAVWQDGALVFQRAAHDVEETVRAFQPLAVPEDIKQLWIEGLRTGRPVAAKSCVGTVH